MQVPCLLSALDKWMAKGELKCEKRILFTDNLLSLRRRTTSYAAVGAYLLYKGTSGKIILPTSASGGKVVGRIFKNLYKTCVYFVQKTHKKRCVRGEISPFAGCNKQHCGRCAVATDACFPQKSGTLRFSICTFFRSDA